MLSIIISSYQKNYYDDLVKNIGETIGDGFQYEIIQIWNPNLMGITKAYNQGAEQSVYENLLFIHEDILFHTNGWGEKLLAHLNQPNAGIIGLAGSSYVPVAPSSWTVSEQYNFVHILQGNKEKSASTLINTTKERLHKVYAVDGVFIAVKKEVFNAFKFNEELLKGFHGYDLDFSLRVSRKFQNYIIDDILIEHFSQGNLDQKWLDANILIKQKQGSDFQKIPDPETEKKIFLGFLYNYFQYYPVDQRNILFTMKFYPFKRINFKDHFLIAKKYYHYLRYSSDINKKLNTTK
ncbi:glycosyltransferase [Chryseobacterium sp. OV279]|uniref:glycosyltransferase n=1 Tax=Chryseobacterium sp. OV279 TaxID=1500285 RepID=UPI000919B39E|nr:glycosyltransferase [Chryseobacterium sp. OV279]SHG40241.1 Glycosyltransferase like family protein [Chryseobacterium sp. OV279]